MKWKYDILDIPVTRINFEFLNEFEYYLPSERKCANNSAISRHLKNIFTEQELDRESVVAKNATTALDGKTYDVEYFNLAAVISVGYRVNSKRGTQFRIWANRILKDYLVSYQ